MGRVESNRIGSGRIGSLVYICHPLYTQPTNLLSSSPEIHRPTEGDEKPAGVDALRNRLLGVRIVSEWGADCWAGWFAQ